MGDEDFLNALEADNAAGNGAAEEEDKGQPQAAPEPKPEAQPEAPKEEPKPRDEHGRFKPKEEAVPVEAAQPAPVTEHVQPQPETPQPAQPEAPHAPLTALLDERDRRQRAEAELERIRQAQAQQQPQEIPDMVTDPEGYNRYVTAQFEEARYRDRLFMSERLARVEHGAETVTKAKEWGVAKCDADPFFNQKVRQSPDPLGVVVEEWKRDQAAAIPHDELEQFRQWKAAQSQLSQPQPQQAGSPAQPNPSPAIPPPSLASAPSAGGVLTESALTEEEIFDETFKRK